jgi:hypothetical protein
MANSGIVWIDFVFNIAVRWLYAWAEFFGITYEEINVWLFCIAWPAMTLAMAVWVVVLVHENKNLRALHGRGS